MKIVGAICLCGHSRFGHWWEITKGSYCLECLAWGKICAGWRETVLTKEIILDDPPPQDAA